MPLHAATFLEAGVTGAKYGLSVLGRMSDEVRLPLVAIDGGDEEGDPRGHGPRGHSINA